MGNGLIDLRSEVNDKWSACSANNGETNSQIILITIEEETVEARYIKLSSA